MDKIEKELIPKKITLGITLVPCMKSQDKKTFIPLYKPLGDVDIQAQQKQPWTDEEDFSLFEMREKNMKWTLISKAINEKFHSNITIRNQKQCRERWNNFLDPNLKKRPFSRKEDELVCKYYEMYKSWAKVAKKMKNRNENQVRNRYKALTSKRPEQDVFKNPIRKNNSFGNLNPIDGLPSMSDYLGPAISTILPSMQLDQTLTPLVSEMTSCNFKGDISDFFSNSFVNQLGSPNTSQVYFHDAKKYIQSYGESYGNSSKFDNILDNFCDQGYS